MGKVAEPRIMVGVTTATFCLFVLTLICTISFSPPDFWQQVPNSCGSDGGGGGGGGSGAHDGASTPVASNGSIKDGGGGGSEAHAVAPSPVASNGSIDDGGGGDGEEDDSLSSLLGSLLRGKDRTELETTGFACDSNPNNDICVSNQLVWIKTTDAGSLTVYLSSSSNQIPPRMVRPYVNKNPNVKEITIQPYNSTTTNTITPPACDVTHDVPAVVFSLGIVGNTFHEYNEIIVPLFLTTRHFNSQFHFVIAEYNHLWVNKYRRILSHLSDYEIINTSQDTRVHCFPGAVTGLHFQNDNLVCKSSDLPVNCSMSDFRQFLRKTFHLKIKNISQPNKKKNSSSRKPVLVLVSRPHSRKFLNEGEMVKVAYKLGFRVILAKPELTSNLDEISRVVNKCDVLVGVHGAGLTNWLFLPKGAVLVQVVPLGVQWASTNYFGIPAAEMGVQYLEYQINPQESSLWDVYGPNHPIVADPDSIHRQGYNVGRPYYFDSQDIRLDLSNFEDILVQAQKLLGR